MLVSAIVAGLLAGFLAGGHIDNLGRVARLRWIGLLFTALVVRLGTEAALRWGVPEVSAYRLPLFALAFGLLAFVLWRNRDRPGMAIALGGTLANAAAILVNGGYMPGWEAAPPRPPPPPPPKGGRGGRPPFPPPRDPPSSSSPRSSPGPRTSSPRSRPNPK